MSKRTIKLRLRRLVRRQRRQVEGIGEVADEHLNRHFFRRLGRLGEVRRFVFGWLALMILLLSALFMQANFLQSQYRSKQPVGGGIFTEGIVGTYNNANPLYATGAVDAAVSQLVFAGLFEYQNGELVPDLAEKIEVDSTGQEYTVTLRPDLTWHDGHKITSEDVVFTYNTIQNPDTQSYLQASWKGIKIEALDENRILFTLPGALSSFPHSLTNGIVPKHLLKDIPPEQLRSHDFNTIGLVGAGPFKFEEVEVDNLDPENKTQRIAMEAFESYHKGRPKINKFIIHTFLDQKKLEKAYINKQVLAASGLAASDTIAEDPNSDMMSLPLAGQVMVFFRTSKPPLDDERVRDALVLGVSRSKVLSEVGYPLLKSDSPLLKSHEGYDKNLIQKTDKIDAAKKILNKAGWKVDAASGIRKKGKHSLSFRLHSEANSEYAAVAQSLQKQWQNIGVDLQVSLQEPEDLKSTVSSHGYDALLYAISTGADPDVYAYWHSSQADVRSLTRLNFSEYKSPKADSSLEAGRSRSDAKIRAVKYHPFLQAWTKDNPALTLYQPRYLYIVREPFYNFGLDYLITPVDRYSNVESWMIREAEK